MSTDVIEFPATDNERPSTTLKDRRRREPRDVGSASTNPHTPEPNDETSAPRPLETTTAAPVPASGPSPDAPVAERNGEEDAATPRARFTSRSTKPRARANDNGNGDDHQPAATQDPAADVVLTRLALLGAATCIALSVVVLGVSMPHLASGVSRITACEFYTAIFMAVVFDLSQVVAEGSVLVMPLLGIASRGHHLVCAFIIAACTLVSMTLNVRAFLEHVTTPFETAMAFAWGGLLPILVLLRVRGEFLHHATARQAGIGDAVRQLIGPLERKDVYLRCASATAGTLPLKRRAQGSVARR